MLEEIVRKMISGRVEMATRNLSVRPKPRQSENDSEPVNLVVPIAKVNEEKREVTGIVLKPEEVDAQGDIMASEIIENAAGDFLANFNKSTTLGLMHKEFNRKFELRQSYVAPGDISIESKIVKAGTWVLVVKVLEDNIWKQVKDGKLTGFSIGGRAKVKELKESEVA